MYVCSHIMANLTLPPLTPFFPPSSLPPSLTLPVPSSSPSCCGRSRCPELANNNQGIALCDTPSLGLDNEQAPDSRFAGLMYLGSYRPVLEPHPHHTSTSNINLEELGQTTTGTARVLNILVVDHS
ncbi:hypothetical protein INR49_027290, partial [Caranx melampygus]